MVQANNFPVAFRKGICMSFVTPFIHSVLEKGICAQSLGSKQKTCGDSEQENDLAKGEKKENIYMYINQKRRKLARVGWTESHPSLHPCWLQGFVALGPIALQSQQGVGTA